MGNDCLVLLARGGGWNPTREILLAMFTRIAEYRGIFPGRQTKENIFIHLSFFIEGEFVKRGRN